MNTALEGFPLEVTLRGVFLRERAGGDRDVQRNGDDWVVLLNHAASFLKGKCLLKNKSMRKKKKRKFRRSAGSGRVTLSGAKKVILSIQGETFGFDQKGQGCKGGRHQGRKAREKVSSERRVSPIT